ncbi:hypothetical protein EON63_15255 [archaeon]|nr:MAG: hypothetical protein EON63_15255 [archaeon]
MCMDVYNTCIITHVSTHIHHTLIHSYITMKYMYSSSFAYTLQVLMQVQLIPTDGSAKLPPPQPIIPASKYV